MAVKTDEEVIKMAQEYLANTNLPTRSAMRDFIGTSHQRIEALAAAGHFKLPAKISPKLKHFYSKSTWHDNFKLPNSH